MDDFCGGPFWDINVVSNTTDPDFTPCFQKTVLTWVPCGFIYAISIFYFYYLCRHPVVSSRSSCLSIVKISLAAVCAACHAVILGAVLYLAKKHNQDVYFAVVLAPALQFIANVLASVIHAFEGRRGVRSSGCMFVYWVIQTVCAIVIYRSIIRGIVLNDGLVNSLHELVAWTIFLLCSAASIVTAALVDKQAAGDAVPQDEKVSPEEGASFLSKITFWWFNGMIIKGYKNPLERQDIWHLHHRETATAVVPVFAKEWDKELKKSEKLKSKPSTKNFTEAKNDIELKDGKAEQDAMLEVKVEDGQVRQKESIVLALIRGFGSRYVIGSCLKLVNDILMFISPLLLKAMITFTRDKSLPDWQGYFYATMMFIIAIVQSLLLHQYFIYCFCTGMNVRTALIASIYRKALKLSSAARKGTTVGEIVNLMSVDAQRFMEITTYLNMLWSAPFQITVSLYLLWNTLGPSVLAGVGVMLLMIPFNALIAVQNRKLQVKQMHHKDDRLKLMNEILNGIKVLKLYAWELSFKDKILAVRSKELNILKKAAYLNAASSFTWTCAPYLVSLTTFAVYVLSSPENILDAEKAFVSMTLFNILRFPMSMLPNLISQLAQVSVSVKRISSFLLKGELDPDEVKRTKIPGKSISVENGTFVWEKDDGPVLEDINLSVKEGSLVAVVGAVGSGKSSLLSALLGEVMAVEGNVNVSGSVAYAAQQAWIQNATLKDNILFGKKYDECEYQKIIKGCALTQDLEILPSGDMTEIGEKGINLSGGQKQRVSLARALYANTDIYFLDDPLSAVDSHVGKHIFEEVIGPKGLLENKTRILVTHGISFLPQVDQIVVLVDGKVSEIGSYQELLQKGGAFAVFLKNYLIDESELDEEDPDNIVERQMREEILSQLSEIDVGLDKHNSPKLRDGRHRSSENLSGSQSRLRVNSVSSVKSKEGQHPGPPSRQVSKAPSMKCEPAHKTDEGKNLQDKDSEKDKLIKEEKSKTGRVKLSVFMAYLRSVGPVVSVIVFVLFTLNQTVLVLSHLWLSDWSNDAARYNGTVDIAQRDMRLGVYGALGVAEGLFVFLGSFLLAKGSMWASGMLHEGLLHNCLRSPMSFYDTTPIGRIVNRFSKDIDVIDVIIRMNFEGFIKCSLHVLSAIIVIAASTPLFMAVILPLGIFYIFVQRFYVATSRQLKRLESVSRSPIYSHFGESVQGASTIRAYAQQYRFIEDSDTKLDDNVACYYPGIVANRWLAMRLEFVGNCIIFFAALFAAVARAHLSPGIVGLSISYSLNITQVLNWMVRMTSELETNIVAVERVKEYSETPTEAIWVVDDNRPKSEWPETGDVNIDGYSTRYREGLDLVLKNINCQIKGGEKVGIVGRTGAGKSSLTLALFRIIEPADGAIKIDGVDITKIGLHDLRSKLTIIPQDPVLFSGTLRMNLDPFEKHSDEELWKALEHAHLKGFVSALTEGLQHECSEGGENLSVGQRQLVCLARALLRKTNILILDEATAAVDLETDDLIQNTIRTEFEPCTVITIAHRLNTILDYTKILVLDAGHVAEYDNPQSLLQQKNSIFYSMAKDAGLVE